MFKIILKSKLIMNSRYYHNIPFLDFYEKITGKTFDFINLRQKNPNLEDLTDDDIKRTLLLLKKYEIEEVEACEHLHIFRMNPIIMDNYAEILKECGFVKLSPKYIIRYHTFVRIKTISELKKNGLIAKDLILEDRLLKLFPYWPETHNIAKKCLETSQSLLNVRMNILQLYLNWRLNISEEDFHKFCRQHRPLRHRPMSDIQTAIDLAENNIKMDINAIRRNGCVIMADPFNTKMIIENVPTLAGLDIREVIRNIPAILKNNYKSIQQIRDILESYNIPCEAQRKYLQVYCLSPKAVQERLHELSKVKEFKALATNPRVVGLIVYKRKVLSRLDKIRTGSKLCYSINHLVGSTGVFNRYLTSFGNRVRGRDILSLMCTLLDTNLELCLDTKVSYKTTAESNKVLSLYILKQLKKHKYWVHVTLNVIHENILLFKSHFSDEVIVRNCHLLMYPVVDIQTYLDAILKMRKKPYSIHTVLPLDSNSLSLNYAELTDDQVMSLILYEIEKKYHFTGDGIWRKEQKVSNRAQI